MQRQRPTFEGPSGIEDKFRNQNYSVPPCFEMLDIPDTSRTSVCFAELFRDTQGQLRYSYFMDLQSYMHWYCGCECSEVELHSWTPTSFHPVLRCWMWLKLQHAARVELASAECGGGDRRRRWRCRGSLLDRRSLHMPGGPSTQPYPHSNGQ